jgi:hypothetical protein
MLIETKTQINNLLNLFKAVGFQNTQEAISSVGLTNKPKVSETINANNPKLKEKHTWYSLAKPDTKDLAQIIFEEKAGVERVLVCHAFKDTRNWTYVPAEEYLKQAAVSLPRTLSAPKPV